MRKTFWQPPNSASHESSSKSEINFHRKNWPIHLLASYSLFAAHTHTHIRIVFVIEKSGTKFRPSSIGHITHTNYGTKNNQKPYESLTSLGIVQCEAYVYARFFRDSFFPTFSHKKPTDILLHKLATAQLFNATIKLQLNRIIQLYWASDHSCHWICYFCFSRTKIYRSHTHTRLIWSIVWIWFFESSSAHWS